MRTYSDGKNYMGPQHLNASGTILCNRYYPERLLVSAQDFSTLQINIKFVALKGQGAAAHLLFL